MVFDLLTIGLGLAITMLGIQLYLYIENIKKTTTLDWEITNNRDQPILICEVGLTSLTERTPLGNDKYIFTTDHHTGYKPIYKVTDDYKTSEIIPLSLDETMMGQRPVLISRETLIKSAYTHEHGPTRQLYKDKINELLQYAQQGNATKESMIEIREMLTILNKEPRVYEEVIQENGRIRDENSRLKGELEESSIARESTTRRTLNNVKDLIRTTRGGGTEPE